MRPVFRSPALARGMGLHLDDPRWPRWIERWTSSLAYKLKIARDLT